MDPGISSSNTTGDRLLDLTAEPRVRAPEMSSFSHPQQLRPLRMEQVRFEGRNKNMYQQNYQSLPQQNNNPQHQQLQQHMYQNQQQLNYQQQQQLNHQQQGLNHQRQQQNFRFSSIQDPSKTSLCNSNNFVQPNTYRNNQKDPGVLSENQRMQMTSQGPQQPIRPQLNNQNYSNIPNQPRMETSKSLNDQMQSNFQNVCQSDYYKIQAPENRSVNLGKKPSDLDLNSHRISSAIEKSNEATIKPQTGFQYRTVSNSKTEILPDSLNEKSSVPSTIDSRRKTEESFISSDASKKTDLESSVHTKKLNSDIKKKEEDRKEQKQNIKDETITIGTVQKNIKFFEENDTAKKPLKPQTPITKKEKTLKAASDVIKKVTYNPEDEGGVDETPVIHPNLRSIFQIPRKVAKIPRVKTNRVSKKLSSKKLLHDHFNKKPVWNEFLKSQNVCRYYKKGNRKKPKTEIYGSKEELLVFFENTKSWRKLNFYESKTSENAKDKMMHKATANGDVTTPKKTPSKLQTPSKRNFPVSPTKTPSKSPGSPGTPGAKSLPKTPESPAPPTPLIKKVPMNKIQVGAAPSPNLKTVKSKVGSLANTTHKPGGGNVKIESHKVDLSNVQPRTEAKNEQYKRSGGDKKIQQVKLQWSAKPKIGSLENATYKPGGGDKKIESVKLDFKEKAKPKVGSKDNVNYTPGGGNVKIENQKLEFKAQSKVGSLDNVKHKPGGGDIKIFDDKTYLRQVSGNSSEGRASGTQACGDLSVVQEVEARNMPTTHGKNTSLKIKKITTIESDQEAPKIKKITEVTVTSQRFEKEKETGKSPTKVKVTYSKIGLPKDKKIQDPIGLVKIPANTHAPVLKPRLNKKDIMNDFEAGSQGLSHENKMNENTTFIFNGNNTGSVKQIPKSSDIPENKLSLKNDLGIPKFLQEETAAQEMIGERNLARNVIDNKSNFL